MNIHHANKFCHTLITALVNDRKVYREGAVTTIARDDDAVYTRYQAVRICAIVKQTSVQARDRRSSGHPALILSYDLTWYQCYRCCCRALYAWLAGKEIKY